MTLNRLQIADTLLLVYGANQHTDYYGDLCLSCLCSQGLATTFHVVQVSHCLACSDDVSLHVHTPTLGIPQRVSR